MPASDFTIFWERMTRVIPRGSATASERDLRGRGRRVCGVCEQPIDLDDATQVRGPHDLYGHNGNCRALEIWAFAVAGGAGGGGGGNCTPFFGSSTLGFGSSSNVFGGGDGCLPGGDGDHFFGSSALTFGTSDPIFGQQ